MFSLDLSLDYSHYFSQNSTRKENPSHVTRATPKMSSRLVAGVPLKPPSFLRVVVVVVLKVGKERTTTPRANDEDVIVVVVVVDRQERDERDDPPPRRSETWSGLWKFSRKRQKARNLEGGVK